jgi:redox-sensing transcriptional repressor
VVSEKELSESSGGLSRAAALRLSQYLRCLSSLGGFGTVSSSQLAVSVGVSDAQVRRDLAAIGHLGQRGVGYDSVALSAMIRRTLGIDREWRAVLVGVGNLARALLKYRGFRDQGFTIVGLFDSADEKIGSEVEGLPVCSIQELRSEVTRLGAELGVIAVPSESAQSVAEALVGAGVKGLLSFAPMMLRVPPQVRVVSVDLAIQFEQLAFLVSDREDVRVELKGESVNNSVNGG